MGSYSNYQSSGVDFGSVSGGPQWSKINPAKVGITSGVSNALSYAATGAQVAGPWGAVGGAVLGIGKGIWDGLTARKEMHEENISASKDFAYNQLKLEEEGAAKMRASSAGQDPGYWQNALLAQDGGKLVGNIEAFISEVNAALKKKKAQQGGIVVSRETAAPGQTRFVNFRAGGSTNLIPKGVYHGRKNELGDKGIPVVVEREGGEMEKVAEIEHNEIIFGKRVTEEMERMVAIFQQNPNDIENLHSLGSLIFNEVSKNTVDNQGELLKNGGSN